jgi:putative tryptophan/tyrosine transport system substrate-binding protein
MKKVQSSHRRRLALAAGSALAIPYLPAWAQSGAVHRVGFLSGGTSSDVVSFLDAFRDGMAQLGYREGRNLRLELRYAEYSADRATKLASEIAALKPAVIVANGGGIGPACRLTPPLPVVFLISGDPVDAGFADSHARPGRNATGVTLLALDLIVKRLEVLKQINPKMRKLAFLASPEHAGQKLELAASRAAAAQLGVEVTYHEARTPEELAAALPAVIAARPDGALLFSDALMVGQRDNLARFFLKHRVPSAAGWVAFAEAGHLVSYGPERHAVWRRLSYFVDKIIRGARPGDLPVELPSVMELAVNRRTAAAMSLTLPQSVLFRADKVIDTSPLG